MESLTETLRSALGVGLDPRHFTTVQVCLRAVVVYLGGLLVLRFGENRFLGKFTAFDIILGFVLGSVLSRAINGSGPLLPTLASAAVLVGLHFLLAKTAFHSHRFGDLVKGEAELLVRDGEIVWDGMRRKCLSERDLLEALRLHAHLDGVEQIREARFERNGDISIVKKKDGPSIPPRVVEIAVREGVQTVRIELG